MYQTADTVATIFGKYNLPHLIISLLSFLKFYLFIYLFIWLHWVFVAARGLSLVVESRGYFSLWCVGFSLRWLLLLRSMGSRHMGSSSCDMRAQ